LLLASYLVSISLALAPWRRAERLEATGRLLVGKSGQRKACASSQGLRHNNDKWEAELA